MIRYIILFLFLWLCGSAAAQTVYWRVSGFSTSTAVRSNPAHLYWFQIVNDSGGQITSGAVSGPNAVVSGSSVTLTFSQYTGPANTHFKMVWGVGASIGSGARGWVFPYQFGTGLQQNGNSGGYDENGNPVSPDGLPVDSNGNPIEPEPERYKATAEYLNTNNIPVTVVVRRYVEGALVGTSEASVEPGQKYEASIVADRPCSISIIPRYDGVENEDEKVEADGEPIFEDDPDFTAIPPGQPGGPGGPPLNTGGVAPGGSQIGGPGMVVDVPRPGNTEGNADARNEELRKEIQRVVETLLAIGNQAADDADRGNGLLNEIAGNTKGGGEGEEEGDPDIPGDFDALEPSELPADATGIGSKMGAIKAAGAAVVDELKDVLETLNLQGQYASGPLVYTINTRFGVVTLDFDAWFGTIIGYVRTFILFAMTLSFFGRMISIVRGAFA